MFNSLNKAKIALDLKRVGLLKDCFKLAAKLPPEEQNKIKQQLHSIVHSKKEENALVSLLNAAPLAAPSAATPSSSKTQNSKLDNKQSATPSAAALTPKADEAGSKETILIEISDDEDDKKGTEQPKIRVKNTQSLLENTETAKIIPLETGVPNKSVPPLIKINGNLGATKKFVPSKKIFITTPLKSQTLSKPLLTARRSFIKIPIKSVVNMQKNPPGQKYIVALKESDPDIIKKLKMNSGLQVSVLNNTTEPQPAKPPPEIVAPVKVQKCEVAKVTDNKNGVKYVRLKRNSSGVELQRCVIVKPKSSGQ